MLEDRLNRTGATESKFLQVLSSHVCSSRLTDREELNTLRAGLDTATAAKRQLELTARQANETCDRLAAANDVLSAKALSLAEDAESERRSLTKKWSEEVETLKKRLEEAQEEADEGKFRGQAQRIQLLDEVSW